MLFSLLLNTALATSSSQKISLLRMTAPLIASSKTVPLLLTTALVFYFVASYYRSAYSIRHARSVASHYSAGYATVATSSCCATGKALCLRLDEVGLLVLPNPAVFP